MSDLTQSAAWKALDAHFATIKEVTMKDMFAEDPARFNKFSVEFEDILLDYSKNRVTEETMKLLYGLAGQQDVLGMAKKMYSGEKISRYSIVGSVVLHDVRPHFTMRGRSFFGVVAFELYTKQETDVRVLSCSLIRESQTLPRTVPSCTLP